MWVREIPRPGQLRRFKFDGTAEKSAEASEEFAEFERFGQVIVSAVIESGNAIFDGVTSGEHEDGNLGARLAKEAANFKAAEAGKHNVEDDQVIGVKFCLLQRIRTGRNSINGIGLFFQSFKDKALHAWIVFREEDSHEGMILEKRREARG